MARKKANTSASTPIDTLRHKDSRKNIPTEELRDFVAEDEQRPKTILYPRDSSLDPQLVWKGKDEQDAQDLAVPAVSNAATWGRWAFLEISDPWDATKTIRSIAVGGRHPPVSARLHGGGR